MKFLKQFLIILVITFMGEGLKYLLPLPIPASIYGMVLLFLALMTGIVKLESVRDAGKFLIEIMPVMFIPAGVGLMVSWGVLKPMLLPVGLITVVSLITAAAATGLVSQTVIRKEQKKTEKAEGKEQAMNSFFSGIFICGRDYQPACLSGRILFKEKV